MKENQRNSSASFVSSPVKWAILTLCTLLLAAVVVSANFALRDNGQQQEIASAPNDGEASKSGSTRKSSWISAKDSAMRHDALVAARKLDPNVTRMSANGVFSIFRFGPSYTQGDRRKFVTPLLSASEAGDAVSSYEVFLNVRACNELMRPRGVVGVDDANSLQECTNLLLDESISSVHWLDRAARQGSIEAMLMYSVNPAYTLGSHEMHLKNADALSDWKVRAVGYLEQAAASGSQDALLALSRAYDEGVLVGADPVRAYGYAVAADAGIQSPQLTELVDQLRRELSKRGEQEGARLAGQIVSGCCKHRKGN